MATKTDNQPDQNSIYDDKTPARTKGDDLEDNFNAPSATDQDLPEGHPSRASNALSPDDLEQAEESGAENPENSPSTEEQNQFFNPSDKPPKRGRFNTAKGLLKKRKQLLIGGVLVSVVGGLVSIIIFLLPSLRLESYMKRINQRAFALATNAVEARTGYLFERYMINHIINLERCKAVRSIECRATYSKGIASNLFNTWRDARLEEKIFDRLGFSIESTDRPNVSEGNHRFTIRDRDGKSITFDNESKWHEFKRGDFTGGRREFGREIRQALKQETKLLNVMERRSVRKYLTRKHGVRLWCWFACSSMDRVELKTATAKTRFKYQFVERLVTPFSSKYGFIMNCIIDPDNKCKDSPEEINKRGVDTSRIPDDELKEIVEHFDGKPNARASTLVLQKMLTKIIGEQAAKKAVGLVPIAGQIYLGIVIVDTLDRADDFVANKGFSKFAASINASQYVHYYIGMRSINDEMKSHSLSLEEVGAVMSGFEGAEKSLVYQSYSNPKTSASLFGDKVYAQAEQASSDEPYICNNGEPIPQGELVCNEKKVARTYAIEEVRGNKFVGGIFEGIFSQYRGFCAGESNTCIGPRTVVRPLLGAIDTALEATVGKISTGLLGLVQKLPGVGDFLTFIFEKTKDLFLAFFEKVFPLPVSIDSPGREMYDGLEAGADVAAAEYAKGGYTDSGQSYGLGAPKIADEDAVAVYADYLNQREYEYQNSGFVAKLTNLERPNSFANNLLATIPNSFSKAVRQLTSSVSSFFTNIFSFKLWDVLFGSSPIYAQSLAQKQLAQNAFGVTRYGYPVDDPSITADPETLTPEFCQKAKEIREGAGSKTSHPLTGFDEFSISNPCLLEESVVESAGAYFTND